MATNQLLPFANGDVPNVLPYDEWNSLPARLTGFQSGIASSKQFNYILAQGGAAGYVIGQMIADFAAQDATLDAVSLYANFKQALEKALPVCPTGMIAFFDLTEVPDGWLVCDGSAVSRTTYASLFAKIGTRHGAGNGSTTFNLPDMDARFLEGTTDTGQVGTKVEPGLPNVTGGITGFNYEKGSGGWVYGAFSTESFHTGSSTGTAKDVARVSFQAQRSSSLYGGSSTVQPSSLRALPCIKI